MIQDYELEERLPDHLKEWMVLKFHLSDYNVGRELEADCYFQSKAEYRSVYSEEYKLEAECELVACKLIQMKNFRPGYSLGLLVSSLKMNLVMDLKA